MSAHEGTLDARYATAAELSGPNRPPGLPAALERQHGVIEALSKRIAVLTEHLSPVLVDADTKADVAGMLTGGGSSLTQSVDNATATLQRLSDTLADLDRRIDL